MGGLPLPRTWVPGSAAVGAAAMDDSETESEQEEDDEDMDAQPPQPGWYFVNPNINREARYDTKEDAQQAWRVWLSGLRGRRPRFDAYVKYFDGTDSGSDDDNGDTGGGGAAAAPKFKFEVGQHVLFKDGRYNYHGNKTRTFLVTGKRYKRAIAPGGKQKSGKEYELLDINHLSKAYGYEYELVRTKSPRYDRLSDLDDDEDKDRLLRPIPANGRFGHFVWDAENGFVQEFTNRDEARKLVNRNPDRYTYRTEIYPKNNDGGGAGQRRRRRRFRGRRRNKIRR